MPLHMIKLVVGCDTIEELVAWQRTRDGGPEWRLRTRQTPKRAEEMLNGGSIYRVFKGVILCRQPILAIETVGEGPAKRCELVLSPEIVRVAPTGRRAFQGWRYLRPEDAPPDLEDTFDLAAAPPALAVKLRELGVW